MEGFDNKRKRYKNGVPLSFIICCFFKYNFKSPKKFIIYILHFSGYLDLRKKDSRYYTDEQLVKILDLNYNVKFNKKDLYELTSLNKNTFNKHFKEYFDLKGYKGKRKFTLFETYEILNEWQGKGKWAMMPSIKKERLAKIINFGNYKALANEFSLIIGEEGYKSKDKFSPKEVKKLLEHIDLSDSKKANRLLQYDKFETLFLCFLGIMILSSTFNKNKKLNTIHT